ncbi:hypothetical protein FDENT_4586 [Fusarium denticulatum]|uniref:Uncharacterized protein n=1 Tax=Fusarium denticulatum TaxID=48507 RepID=A0A8H5UKJ6_9HYPO|nr:hypothetical protein FDENT_4586 [Fusarium denticulatum]
MKLSNQVSKFTEIVADLKVGPRSRRSSASSRKSGDSDITNLIKHEVVDSFIADEDILTIFQAFMAETGNPVNPSTCEGVLVPGNPRRNHRCLLSLEDHDIIRLYNVMSVKYREQKAQGKGKKAVVQTRTESFQTAIDGDDTTPHRRGEMRKAPKTPVTAGRMRCHLLFMDRSPLPLPQQQPRHSLIEIYHTAAAEVTEKVDVTSRASNANIQHIDDIWG